MASTKTINTRIQNKIDSLENWQASKSTLLKGEIAIARVKTSEKYNPITNQNEPEWELLMKVGDGNHTFNDTELPWLSAKAADVYAWAKNKNIEDVNVNVYLSGNTEATSSSLATWLKTIYENSENNKGRLDEHDQIFSDLLGDGEDSLGTIQEQITAAINALDQNADLTIDEVRDDCTIVKAVAQTDGKITVSYGTIQETELPDISANKIVVAPETGTEGQPGYVAKVTLDKKLEEVDGRLDAHDDILAGVVDSENGIDTVVKYVESKIGALDLTADHVTVKEEAAYSFVTAIAQEDGQVSYTTQVLPEAKDDANGVKGIVAIGVANGAASHNAIFGQGGLESKVTSNTSEIDEIRGLIASGVHFRGITTTDLREEAPTRHNSEKIQLVTGDAENPTIKDYDAIEGDIVIYKEADGAFEREFIWTGDFWEELGNVTRLGDLEKLTNSFATETKNAWEDHKFVTHITKETNGTYTVNKAQPTSKDVKHNSTSSDFIEGTVGAELVSHDSRLEALETTVDLTDGQTVSGAIDAAIQNLTFAAPTATDDSNNPIEFIDSVTLGKTDGDDRGVVTLTKKRIREATTSSSGIVKLNDSVESDSTTTAATPNAVKTAYDVATDAKSRVESVEANYVKFVPVTDGNGDVLDDGSRGTLRVGAADTDITLIFDCGGALDIVYFSAETSIDNFKAYTAIEGMTWSEWVASEYNETLPGGMSFYEHNGKIYSPADSVVDVAPDTVITATRYLIKR